jgi:hypothetical protein
LVKSGGTYILYRFAMSIRPSASKLIWFPEPENAYIS